MVSVESRFQPARLEEEIGFAWRRIPVIRAAAIFSG